ncbi:hypothetical protein AOG27_00720 [Pseudoalteromonas lipolytica]|uniref:Membrane protein triplicated sequence n=1 Tax=Pseudoalteromonas lipolytica TaxID=570156 RepID=A0A0P7DYY3_9GAMM|nr:hypothetical protein AOG27_00720 [Pseudoalteromonas lipolytica]
MYISDFVGSLIGSFIEWGFLMAFLFNLVTHINKPDKRLVILAFIMMVSYFLSGIFHLSIYSYLNWFYFDLLTITTILAWICFTKICTFNAIYYIVFGLLLNATLMISIFLDIFVIENRTPWALWSIYSFGVNTVDIIMLIALITNRDFFLLHKLCRLMKYKIRASFLDKPEHLTNA